MAMRGKRGASTDNESTVTAPAGGLGTSVEGSISKERVWREELSKMLSPEELRMLSEQSLSDTFTAIGVLWAEAAVLLVAANLLPHLTLAWAIPAGILVVLLMGLRMNAFGVILHEGSHGLLAKACPTFQWST